MKQAMKIGFLVDFPDDIIVNGVFSVDMIDSYMRTMKDLGAQQVVWSYYGDGRGGYITPRDVDGREDYKTFSNMSKTYSSLGNPLRQAVIAAHRYGIELYVLFKPYETGLKVLPQGSPEGKHNNHIQHKGGYVSWLDPFVKVNPELRIAHKDYLSEQNAETICTIKLIKSNDAPTRIKKENLQIWVSDSNYKYERISVDFDFKQSVESSDREIRDVYGNLLTPKKAPVRILEISNLNLKQKYILITTDFENGPGDFENSGIEILRAYNGKNEEIKGVFANGGSITDAGKIDFRKWGLSFDYGWTGQKICLDNPNNNTKFEGVKRGFVAFTRGRNRYVTGGLCETEPKVQEFWLNCVKEMIDAGVDGVQFRIENHSMMTDYPSEYGFNEVILKQCKSTHELDLIEEISKIRGQAYTDFLSKSKKLLSDNGIKMRVNLNLDYFRDKLPLNMQSRLMAFPANIEFDWKSWIDEGLMDEANIKAYHRQGWRETVFEYPEAKDMVYLCNVNNIPVYFTHHIYNEDNWYYEQAMKAANTNQFAGIILYEAASFFEYDKKEEKWNKKLNIINNIVRDLSK